MHCIVYPFKACNICIQNFFVQRIVWKLWEVHKLRGPPCILLARWITRYSNGWFCCAYTSEINLTGQMHLASIRYIFSLFVNRFFPQFKSKQVLRNFVDKSRMYTVWLSRSNSISKQIQIPFFINYLCLFNFFKCFF